jgi:hypothetical protein
MFLVRRDLASNKALQSDAPRFAGRAAERRR